MASPHALGATFAVRAQPRARRNLVLGDHGGSLKVAVTAPAEGGRANAAIVEVVSDWLGLKRSDVSVASGATSRNKTFLIRGFTAQQLSALIASRLV